jgi:hypothetical protein
MARAALIWLVLSGTLRAAPLDIQGCGQLVNEAELRALLRIELPHPPLGMSLRCRPDPIIHAGDRDETLTLVDVPRRMRARTLALALAERARREQLEPRSAEKTPEPIASPPLASPEPIASPQPIASSPIVPAASPPPLALPTAAAATSTPPTTTPPRRSYRRLYGGLATGLFAYSLAGFAVGGTIVGIEPVNPDFSAYHISGDVLLITSAVAFTGSVITFALWLRERRAHR